MVKIRFGANKLVMDEPILWNNIFPYYTVPKFVGKKRKHVMDLLSALELRGASTISEIASFVIESHYSEGQIEELGKYFVKRRGHYYWNHLYGFENKKAKKKIGVHNGLLEKNYVKIIELPKTRVGVYFPTLMGHLISLGYKYSDSETKEFIKNASTNSLYFAFLNDIMEKISLEFVKEIFLNPIKKMIRQSRIRFDDDYRLNFDIIASATALKIRQIIDVFRYNTDYYDLKTRKPLDEIYQKIHKQLDTLIKNTWFNLQGDSKWQGQLIELYYATDKQRIFYSQHSDFSDGHLIYKVMREIHVNYYGSHEVEIPKKYLQKFPIPIRRDTKRKENQE